MRPSIGRPSIGRPSISRASIGGGQLSIGTNRFSIGTGAVRRSVAPAKPTTTKEEDIQALLGFFDIRQPQFDYSEKLLKSPRFQDFKNWFEFLIHCLDPDYQDSPDRKEFEKRVPAILNLYGYPFTIKESMMVSVNTPHNWPNFLRALHWLVKKVNENEEEEAKKLNTSIDMKNNDTIRLKYLYSLCGKDGINDIKIEEIKADEYLEVFRNVLLSDYQQNDDEKEMDRLNALIRDKQESIHLEDKAITEIENEKIQILKAIDNAKRENVEKLERSQREKLEIANIESEHKVLLEEIEASTSDLSSLKNKVQDQPMSAQEARELKQKAAQVRQQLAETKKINDQLHRESSAKKNDFHSFSQETTKMFRQLFVEVVSKAREVNVDEQLISQFETALFAKNKETIRAEQMTTEINQTYQTLLSAIVEGIKKEENSIGLDQLNDNLNRLKNEKEDWLVKIKMLNDEFTRENEKGQRTAHNNDRLLCEARKQYENITKANKEIEDQLFEAEARVKSLQHENLQLQQLERQQHATKVQINANIEKFTADFTPYFKQAQATNFELKRINEELSNKLNSRIEELKNIYQLNNEQNELIYELYKNVDMDRINSIFAEHNKLG